MHVTLYHSNLKRGSNIAITGSKSESNRLLLLQALYPEIDIENLSNSDDSQLMRKALSSNSDLIDIHHAGTAMRFLTAYFAIQKNRTVVLTGSERMQERPIKILVDALTQLGAEIEYENKKGYPPLKIKGTTSLKSEVSLKANVSSQYISALLLIASKLQQGLNLELEGKITSVPYINMTLSLLNEIGIESTFINNTITINPNIQKLKPTKLIVESDWSSASYFYSAVALSKIDTEISLSSFKQNSLQGDSSLTEIYKLFGIDSQFNNHVLTLKKRATIDLNKVIELDLSNAPDLAQTIAVTCLGLGLKCHLTGLHTLKIKETDRLVALKNEIEKFGTEVIITDSELSIENPMPLHSNVAIDTYKDHRMAMAFAPLALKTEFCINDADVVSKSYPDFWKDLSEIGFQFTES